MAQPTLPGDQETTSDLSQAVAAARRMAPTASSKSAVSAVHEQLVVVLADLINARNALRSVSETLLMARAEASPWQKQTGAMTALTAAQLDEQIGAMFTAMRSVRTV